MQRRSEVDIQLGVEITARAFLRVVQIVSDTQQLLALQTNTISNPHNDVLPDFGCTTPTK